MPKVRSKGFANPAQTWDARFSTDSYIFGTEPNVWLSQHRALLQPGARVLAVADGEGRNSVWMAQQGLKVDAFDISPVGVDKARKLAQQQGVDVHFSVCGVEDYPWKALEYDAVIAIFIQFADPPAAGLLAEAARVQDRRAAECRSPVYRGADAGVFRRHGHRRVARLRRRAGRRHAAQRAICVDRAGRPQVFRLQLPLSEPTTASHQGRTSVRPFFFEKI